MSVELSRERLPRRFTRGAPLALLTLLALLAGCSAAPARAIPSERRVFEGRPYAFGRALLASGREESVLEVQRAGPREDVSVFIRVRAAEDPRSGRKLDLDADSLEAGRTVPRPPLVTELEEVTALLSPRNPAWRRGLEPWLRARVGDLDELRGVLVHALDERREAAAAQGWIADLAEAYHGARDSVELRELEERRENTVFVGLAGWQRGAFSGYSWSFPFHAERYDRSEDRRELVLPPLLSAGRLVGGGFEGVAGPLLAYYGRLESPVERAGGLVLLGAGRTYRESLAGRASTTVFLPLLAVREASSHTADAAGEACLAPGERSRTHVLGSLLSWSRERPAIYRAAFALRTVGRDRRSFRLLPLLSHDRDERGSDTVLWPLLGFGFGDDDGRGFVRLFYFLKLGGGGT